jgi:hypothetical protein
MKRSRILLLTAIGAVCALGGAAAGIAETSASSSRGPTVKTRLGAGIARAHRGLLFRMGPLKDAAGPPVHSEAVVPNNKGGFETITIDRGRVVSLSADNLTITEGTRSATYKQATLTIPARATVLRDREPAQLSDVKAGDRVVVAQSPAGTFVRAHDPQHVGRLKREMLKPGAPPPGVPKNGSAPAPPTLVPPPGEASPG